MMVCVNTNCLKAAKQAMQNALSVSVAFVVITVLSAGMAHATPEDVSRWVEMPEGARKAYVGIHGGTVPVSLLTAGDGTPMIAQVGLTGSDFLHFMRSRGKTSTDLGAEPTPTIPAQALAATPLVPTTEVPSGTAVLQLQQNEFPAEIHLEASSIPTPMPIHNATILLAGTAAGDVPVIYATGRSFESMAIVPANWAPFGLTAKALSFEGAVKIPSPKDLPRRKKRR